MASCTGSCETKLNLQCSDPSSSAKDSSCTPEGTYMYTALCSDVTALALFPGHVGTRLLLPALTGGVVLERVKHSLREPPGTHHSSCAGSKVRPVIESMHVWG